MKRGKGRAFTSTARGLSNEARQKGEGTVTNNHCRSAGEKVAGNGTVLLNDVGEGGVDKRNTGGTDLVAGAKVPFPPLVPNALGPE